MHFLSSLLWLFDFHPSGAFTPLHPELFRTYPIHTLSMFPRTLSPTDGTGWSHSVLWLRQNLSSGIFKSSLVQIRSLFIQLSITQRPLGAQSIQLFQTWTLILPKPAPLLSCFTQRGQNADCFLRFPAKQSLGSVNASFFGVLDYVLLSNPAPRPSTPLGSPSSGIPFLLSVSFLASFLSFSVSLTRMLGGPRPPPGISWLIFAVIRHHECVSVFIYLLCWDIESQGISGRVSTVYL